MEKTAYLPLRILLWVICAYHLVAGVAATFFQASAVRVGSVLFGVQINMTPQAELLVRYLGALCISLAVLAAFAALDPGKNRKIIYGLVVYFAVRAFDRIVFWKLLEEHSTGVAPGWFRILMICVMAGGLLYFSRPPRAEAVA